MVCDAVLLEYAKPLGQYIEILAQWFSYSSMAMEESVTGHMSEDNDTDL